MLGSLVSSQFEHRSFYEGPAARGFHDQAHTTFHIDGGGAPLNPLHFALASTTFTSEATTYSFHGGDSATSSICSFGGASRSGGGGGGGGGSSSSSTTDVTSSGSTTRRSSCETPISSTHTASTTLLHKPHKAQDLAWIAIHTLKLRGEEITMASLKVLYKLGQGDSGSVYLTQLRGTSCLFALKVVDKEKLMKKNKIQRMHIEREILELVDHPFLPTLYAHFDMGQFSCLLMEFCSGGDLHALLHRQLGNRFALKVVRFYAAQVVVALEYLHMHGIIYRDLKPENVLLRENGHIMLSDFDLCIHSHEPKPTVLVKLPVSSISSRTKRRILRQYLKIQSPPPPTKSTRSTCIHTLSSCMRLSWAERRIKLMKSKKRVREDNCKVMYTEVVVEPTHVRATSMVGTHEYLAPEVVGGWGHGNAVDWWMLGILIYELLFARTPFKGCNNKHTLHNIIKQQLRFPQDNEIVEVDGACKALLRGLLTKEPAKRLGSIRGASEIKNHPFFKGVNWALIRTTKPPPLHFTTLPHHLNRHPRFGHLDPTLSHFEHF